MLRRDESQSKQKRNFSYHHYTIHTSQPRFQDDYDYEDGVSDAMFNLRKSKSSQELRSNRLSVDAASTMMMMTRRKGSADFVTTTADGRLGEFGFGRNPFPHLETG